MCDSIRILGSSGFCGFLGLCKGKIGKFEMYITERCNLFLIVTSSKRNILNTGDNKVFTVQLSRLSGANVGINK